MPVKYISDVREFPRFKVAYFVNDRQICDAIWGCGSYGYEENLLEFYCGGEPEGYITERRAFNLFKEHMEATE